MVANIQLLLLMPIKLQLMLVMLLIWMGMVIWMALIILQLLRMILIISMDNAEWAHKAPDLARLWSSKEAADALCLGHLDSGYPNCCGRLMHDALDIWIGLAPARANCWSFSWRWSSKGRIDLTMLDADVTGVVANHRIHDFAAAMTSPSTISTRSDEGEDATNADLSLVTFRESFDLGEPLSEFIGSGSMSIVRRFELVKSLRREAQHPAIITFRAWYEGVDRPVSAYILMDLCSTSVEDFIKKEAVSEVSYDSRVLITTGKPEGLGRSEVEEVIKGFLQVRLDVWYRNSWVMADRHYEDLSNSLQREFFDSLKVAYPVVVHQSLALDQGPDCQSQVQDMGFQLIRGVDYLHHKRVVHRDIKPANLLLHRPAVSAAPSPIHGMPEGEVPMQWQLKITDFNSAKRVGKGNGLLLTDRGTQLFNAPELRFGRLWNERVDIWACGLCLYFMLAKHVPFNIGDQKVANTLLAGKLPQVDWSIMSPLAGNLIRQCLLVDPCDRPTAMELPAFASILWKVPHSETMLRSEESTSTNSSFTASRRIALENPTLDANVMLPSCGLVTIGDSRVGSVLGAEKSVFLLSSWRYLSPRTQSDPIIDESMICSDTLNP
ncbi:snfA [Symbiodinium microadriaticum]|nr:snfA [Symbiodinium microadriaticum]